MFPPSFRPRRSMVSACARKRLRGGSEESPHPRCNEVTHRAVRDTEPRGFAGSRWGKVPRCRMRLLRIAFVLFGAAMLEVGGDALVRMGLQRRPLPMIAGAACLVVYGVLVNQGGADFGKLMGGYIVVFFLVSQVIALLVFGQAPGIRTLIGGALMLAAGITLLA